MAGWSLAVLQVRCLGTMGGCLGMAVGAIAGLWLAGAITDSAFALIPGAVIGAFIGTIVGLFVALRMMAR